MSKCIATNNTGLFSQPDGEVVRLKDDISISPLTDSLIPCRSSHMCNESKVYDKHMSEDHQRFIEDKYVVHDYKAMIFRMFNEDSLSRVWQHYQDGFILVSAFRGENSQEENMKRHEELKKIVRNRIGGFSVLDGVWIENRGKKNEKRVSELSFFFHIDTR